MQHPQVPPRATGVPRVPRRPRPPVPKHRFTESRSQHPVSKNASERVLVHFELVILTKCKVEREKSCPASAVATTAQEVAERQHHPQANRHEQRKFIAKRSVKTPTHAHKANKQALDLHAICILSMWSKKKKGKTQLKYMCDLH